MTLFAQTLQKKKNESMKAHTHISPSFYFHKTSFDVLVFLSHGKDLEKIYF